MFTISTIVIGWKQSDGNKGSYFIRKKRQRWKIHEATHEVGKAIRHSDRFWEFLLDAVKTADPFVLIKKMNFECHWSMHSQLWVNLYKSSKNPRLEKIITVGGNEKNYRNIGWRKKWVFIRAIFAKPKCLNICQKKSFCPIAMKKIIVIWSRTR